MRKTILLLLFVFSGLLHSQTLISSYPLPYYNPYNSLWGITSINDTLWTGSDFTGGTSYPFSKLFKITKTGIIVDSLTTSLTFNHGLVWDGTGFWIAESYRSSGARIYKINLAGAKIDSIYTGAYAQGIGGLALEGNNIWFSVYSPDFTSYPFAYAYKMNLTSKLLVDSIPLRGKQVYGIALKGDTILYASNSFQGDPERIYGYRKIVGDTVLSFAAPDPDGSCDPKGLAWDGQYLWLIAYRVGNNVNAYRTIYKYGMTGGGTPIISTSSVNFDFGNTLIGSTTTRTLSITNVGTSKLIITAKNINNPRFGILQNSVPDTISINQTKDYTLSYSPLVFGNDSASLSLVSNDPATPTKNISLKGRGIYTGSFAYFPVPNYDYGARRQNSLCGFTLPVTNRGNAPMIINSISLATSRFKLDTVGLTFPVTIDTQKTKTFRIWYNPIGIGNYKDSVKIVSNAVNLPTAYVPLMGNVSTVNYDALGTILWQGLVPDNPNSVYNYPKPISMKQINDVNSDGYNDVLVATDNYQTICYNGSSSVTSDILWIFNTYTSTSNVGSVPYEEAMQVRDDIDGDGIQDIVIGCYGGNHNVYTISGRTGKMIWTFGDTLVSNKDAINGIRVDKDYNGDGVKDVIAAASGTGVVGDPGRRSVYCLNGLNGNVIFQCPETDWEFLLDLADNQIGGAVSVHDNYGPYGVRGFNNAGSNVWTYSSMDAVWEISSVKSIDSDTIKDYLCFEGFNGKIFALNGQTGTEMWNRTLGGSVNGNMKIMEDYSFGNNIYRIMVSGSQTLHLIDPVTSTSYWSNSLDNTYVFGVCKLNYGNFYKPRVVAATFGNKVYVCDYSNGNIAFQYSFGNGGPGTAAEKVTDLKSVRGSYAGEYSDEFVAGCRDGRIVCFSGGRILTPSVHNIGNNVPDKFKLEQNYPNPFNPVTKIKFDIPKSAVSNSSAGNTTVVLKIFDILGKEIATIVNEKLQPGQYETEWNASNFSSGIYFYSLSAGNYRETKKLMVVK